MLLAVSCRTTKLLSLDRLRNASYSFAKMCPTIFRRHNICRVLGAMRPNLLCWVFPVVIWTDVVPYGYILIFVGMNVTTKSKFVIMKHPCHRFVASLRTETEANRGWECLWSTFHTLVLRQLQALCALKAFRGISRLGLLSWLCSDSDLHISVSNNHSLQMRRSWIYSIWNKISGLWMRSVTWNRFPIKKIRQ